MKKYFWEIFEEKFESQSEDKFTNALMTMTKSGTREDPESDDADLFARNSNLGTLLTESSETSDRDIHSEDYHAIPLERNVG